MHGPAAPGWAASPGTRNGTGREPPASPSEPAAHAHCYPRAPSCPLRPRLRVTHAPSRSARARRLAPRPLPRLRSQAAPVPSSPPHLPRRGSRERSGGSQSAPAEGGPSPPPLQPPAGRGGGEEAAAASSSVPPAPWASRFRRASPNCCRATRWRCCGTGRPTWWASPQTTSPGCGMPASRRRPATAGGWSASTGSPCRPSPTARRSPSAATRSPTPTSSVSSAEGIRPWGGRAGRGRPSAPRGVRRHCACGGAARPGEWSALPSMWWGRSCVVVQSPLHPSWRFCLEPARGSVLLGVGWVGNFSRRRWIARMETRSFCTVALWGASPVCTMKRLLCRCHGALPCAAHGAYTLDSVSASARKVALNFYEWHL